MFAAAAVALVGASVTAPAVADTRFKGVTISAPDSVDLELGASTVITVTLDLKSNQPNVTHLSDVWAEFASHATTVKSLKFELPAPCQPGPRDSFMCRWDSLPVGQTKIAVKVTSIVTDPRVSHEMFEVAARDRYSDVTDRKQIDVVHRDAVDFAVLDKDAPSTRKPGATFSVPMGFENVRDRTLTDVSLIARTQYGLEPAKKYENCRYGVQRGTVSVVVCDFKGPIKAGESFRLAEAYPYRVTPDFPIYGAQAYYEFARTTEVEKQLNDPEIRWSPGTGSPLKLTATPTKAPNKRDASGSFDVMPEENQPQSTTSTPPISVVADPDLEVPVRVVVKNDGPAVLNSFRTGGPGRAAGIAFPKGVQVSGVPKECSHGSLAAIDDSLAPLKAAGADIYGCELPEGEPWKVGTTREFTFKVKLAKGLTDAKGGIHTVAGAVPLVDMVFTAKEGATSGGSAATGGGNGTELANTGSDSSSTTLIIGGAVALFALGGGAFLVVRRRRNAGLAA
ncbi:LAETG motif-containing sortase-dependent surface protein [Embleya sp. NPDC056575]|uniref:LAETG motif-containing sortase-dependent surface protein n=1 Tax=unclassified Embleya TaxID=2699296 RepID=UPI0036A929C5